MPNNYKTSSKKISSLEPSFFRSIGRFLYRIGSLEGVLPMQEAMMKAAIREADHKFKSLLEKKGKKRKDKDGKTFYIIQPEFVHITHNAYKELAKLFIVDSLMPGSFLVSLVSLFDAFLGDLIKTMFYKKPELLKKVFSLKKEENIEPERIRYLKTLLLKVFECKNVKDAKKFVIESEIAKRLEGKRTDLLQWLELLINKKDLSQNFPAWPRFIEITERRNLIVHCDGIVNEKYIDMCKSFDVLGKNISAGAKLSVTPKYFHESSQTIIEIGVELGHIIWRQILPGSEDVESANINLNDICFDLIKREEYQLALRLLDFALMILGNQDPAGSDRLYFIVNKAQVLKWLNRSKEARAIINSVKWENHDIKFKLARAVLLDDFKEAANLMKRIGKNNPEISKKEYQDWPLFKQFVKSSAFQKTYQSVFHERYKAPKQVINLGNFKVEVRQKTQK
jgi:hypothetical protein